jgi:hypothetical protein
MHVDQTDAIYTIEVTGFGKDQTLAELHVKMDAEMQI